MVPGVASDSTTPSRCSREAGFSAGSMATMGRSAYSARRAAAAALVAVLQAITMALTPLPSSSLTTCRDRANTSSRGFVP